MKLLKRSTVLVPFIITYLILSWWIGSFNPGTWEIKQVSRYSGIMILSGCVLSTILILGYSIFVRKANSKLLRRFNITVYPFPEGDKLNTVVAFIEKYITDPNREKLIRIVEENDDMFNKSPGSKYNHQAWEGGYIDHLIDMFRIVCRLHDDYNRMSTVDISLESAILVTFLHDIEKPWKYVDGLKFESKLDRANFRNNIIKKYGILLSANEWRALTYVEGEGNDYSSTERVMNEVGALVHCADVISARIGYDYKKPVA